MAKRSKYICQQCGYSQVGWAGKCPECDSWGSLVESLVDPSSSPTKSRARAHTPTPLNTVSPKKSRRLSTKIKELDHLLGGGLVPGQAILLAGEPGIGKSTILLQLSQKIPNSLYISGEESISQIKLRADRLKIKNKTILLLEETNVDSILATIRQQTNSPNPPGLIIIDSIQTLSTSDLSGMAGSVGQVRESTQRLIKLAKSISTPLIIVGHVTKQGSVAGPATLAHMVDTVCWFEGDKDHSLRVLRSLKNRFGPTDEIGLFQMLESGLQAVDDASNLFISDIGRKSVPGSALCIIMEGSRPMLVEIQSLVVPSKMAFPRRIAQGLDSKRLEVLLAVLSQRCNLPLYNSDVFVNVVGGITLKEPAADLAVSLSIASAFKNISLPYHLVALGEIGLLGEIRPATSQDKRLTFAKRNRFTNLVSSQNYKFISQAINTLVKKQK